MREADFQKAPSQNLNQPYRRGAQTSFFGITPPRGRPTHPRTTDSTTEHDNQNNQDKLKQPEDANRGKCEFA